MLPTRRRNVTYNYRKKDFIDLLSKKTKRLSIALSRKVSFLFEKLYIRKEDINSNILVINYSSKIDIRDSI